MHRGLHWSWTVPLIAAVVACGEPGTRVRILDRVTPDGTLTFTEVQLTALRDLETLEGERVRLFGGARLDLVSPHAQLDRGAARGQWVDGGRAVRLRWIDDGGLVVPADFDSLCMLTAYAHFEAATALFAELGVSAAVEQSPVYYHPHVVQNDAVPFPTTDNAAYLPEADGFVLVPMNVLQEIPFSMNPGVITHEYAHRVFYYQLWGGQMFAAMAEHQMTLGSLNSWNRLRATDEGVADFFGAVLSGDPDFLAHSVPDILAMPRSLRATWILDPAWVNGLEPTTADDDYARYLPGSVVAAALWRLAELAGHRQTAAAVIEAQRQLQPGVIEQFTYRFGELEARVIGALPTEHRAAACQAMATPYAAVWSAFDTICP